MEQDENQLRADKIKRELVSTVDMLVKNNRPFMALGGIVLIGLIAAVEANRANEKKPIIIDQD